MKATYKAVFKAALILTGALSASSQAATILYSQGFEAPVGWVQGFYTDVSDRPVNSLYANQPTGFVFAQAFTVETVWITGGNAFGTGYSDPTGRGGNYALGMLSSVQDDLLAMSFDVGSLAFLNFQFDVSRLALAPGGQFANAAPSVRVRLFDNPSGAANLSGNGTVLSSATLAGADSPSNNLLTWTTLLAGLDASASTNGRVTLQIDFLAGGYSVLDNFLIAASNTVGDVTPGGPPVTPPVTPPVSPPNGVPEPGTIALLLCLAIVARAQSKRGEC
jgi:hypothetical protein